MKQKRTIERSTPDKRRKGKTDWKSLAARSDREVRSAVRTDPDAAPVADAEWFRRARIVLPEPKQAVSLRVDREVLDWFKRQGPGYQTRMNAVLRAYADARR